VVFGFLAVVGKRHIAPSFGQHHRRSRSQHDAFISRAEQHIERYPALENRTRIKPRQRKGGGAIVKQPGVEKIRRQPPSFGNKLAKAQHILLQRKAQKILPKIAHDAFPEIKNWKRRHYSRFCGTLRGYEKAT